jgi:hypothetical protein
MGVSVTISEMKIYCHDTSMAKGTDTGLSRPGQGLRIPEG